MNKVVLITGASGGLGNALSKEYAKNGYDLILTYNNSKEKTDELKKELEDTFNVKIYTIKCDLSMEDEIKNIATFVKENSINIDILINNAAIAIDTTLEDKTSKNFKKILDINLIGTFLLTREIGNIMNEQSYGSIVNISSTNGIDTCYIESIDYDASKAGVISLTHNFAKYYAPNVRVNCVCPGWINTEMNKEMSEEFKNEEINKILLKRFAEPDEIAKVVYDVSTSTYMTNSIIRIDGGELC